MVNWKKVEVEHHPHLVVLNIQNSIISDDSMSPEDKSTLSDRLMNIINNSRKVEIITLKTLIVQTLMKVI